MQKKVEVIYRQKGRLTSLVEDLLDVSRALAGRFGLEPEETDLCEATRDLAGRFREQLSCAGCELRLSGPESCVGQWDRLRIEQVIANLLSNAIKYGAGRPIEVRVGVEGEDATLEVEDHGIGIAPADQQRIFERFERAVSKRHYGGLGLGLWIVRQIVEAIGGRIAVSSTPRQGSTFRGTLPENRRGWCMSKARARERCSDGVRGHSA